MWASNQIRLPGTYEAYGSLIFGEKRMRCEKVYDYQAHFGEIAHREVLLPRYQRWISWCHSESNSSKPIGLIGGANYGKRYMDSHSKRVWCYSHLWDRKLWGKSDQQIIPGIIWYWRILSRVPVDIWWDC